MAGLPWLPDIICSGESTELSVGIPRPGILKGRITAISFWYNRFEIDIHPWFSRGAWRWHPGAVSDGQARSQGFVQEGANLARAQGTPYQTPKTPQIWPTIFGSGPVHFLLSYFAVKFYLIFPLRGGEHDPFALPPLATSLVMGGVAYRS